MDGVVSDFDRGAQEWYGKKIPEGEPREWNYKYDQRPYEFNDWFGMSEKGFWAGLGEAFWANLPKTPWADELVEWLESLFPGRVVFLSSPPIKWGSSGASGKQAWINKHYPTIFQEGRVILTQSKYLLARPGALLIDDCEHYVDTFWSNGGEVVMVPQPWNDLREYTGDRLGWVKAEVGGLLSRRACSL